MWSLLSTLIVCCTVLAIVWRVEQLVRLGFAHQQQRAALAAQPAPRQEQVSIPEDLYAMAQSYEDVWAREQAELALREMYGQLGSWDLVRVNYGNPGKGHGDDR